MSDRQSTQGTPAYFSKRQWAIAIAVMILAFLLGGMLVVIPRNLFSVHASGGPSIILVPKKANYKAQSGIVVKGNGFGATESVKIYWNYTGPGTGTYEITANADGTGTFSTKFPTPLTFTGTYTIAAIGQTSGSVATAPFILLPQIYASPQAGGPGGKPYIYGNAFASGETVNIYWDYTGPGTGTLMATTSADTVTGSFATKGTIPANTSASPGNVPIVGIGQISKASDTYTFILYQPTVALGPMTGSAQSLVTVTAYGFQENENVNVYWNNGTTPVITAKTNSNVYGYMPPQTFTIPAGTAPGSYPVTAIGQTSTITISNTFTVVAPGSSLSITAGPVGTSTIVSGAGYTPGEVVNVIWSYSGPGTGKSVATTTAGASGLVNVSFNVPTATSGSHTVAVIGATSGSLVKDVFKVQTGLASNPATTPPGSNVTLAGTGYQANEPVHIYLDSASGTPFATATADANGNISQAAAIPASATPGSHNLVGVGQTSGTSLTGALNLDTPWGDLGFDDANTRDNPYENTLNVTNVSGLKEKWMAQVPTGQEGSPIYASGLVYIATANGIINAYHAQSGSLKWSFNSNTSFPNFSAPLVDPVNNLVFFGTIGYQDSGIPSPFYALDAQSGKLVWSMIIPWNDFGFPSLHSGTIYVGNVSSLAIANGVAYVGSLDTNVYALNASTGVVLWKTAPIVVNGWVYCAATNDQVFGFSL
jgi:outer membrane protein assembly factor BamB